MTEVLTKGSVIGVDGYKTFTCESFNGNLVFGTEIIYAYPENDCGGYNYDAEPTEESREMCLTLSECSLYQKEFDGKNHKYVWDF